MDCKVCSKCKEMKLVTEFHTDKTSKDGLNYTCKTCKSEYNKQRNQVPEIIAYRSKYMKERRQRPEVKAADSERTKKRRLDPTYLVTRRKYDIQRGQMPEVKQAKRQADMQRRYGLTLTDYDRKLNEQNNVCAICGQLETSKGKTFFAIDHNHNSGKIRGLLCSRCNTSLARFEEYPVEMQAYLSKYEEQQC